MSPMHMHRLELFLFALEYLQYVRSCGTDGIFEASIEFTYL